jgi:hypothetical protein
MVFSSNLDKYGTSTRAKKIVKKVCLQATMFPILLIGERALFLLDCLPVRQFSK